MSYNSATIIGRLGQDPQVRYTQSNTAVANLSVATSERYKDRDGEYQEKTTWHDVTVWGRKAEVAQEYLKKGSLVHITGPIEKREWEKDGVKRVSTEIKALTMTMLDSKGNSQGSLYSSDRAYNVRTASQGSPDTSSAHDPVDFDDLPFTWLLMIGGTGLMQVILNSNLI